MKKLSDINLLLLGKAAPTVTMYLNFQAEASDTTQILSALELHHVANGSY